MKQKLVDIIKLGVVPLLVWTFYCLLFDQIHRDAFLTSRKNILQGVKPKPVCVSENVFMGVITHPKNLTLVVTQGQFIEWGGYQRIGGRDVELGLQVDGTVVWRVAK